MREFTVTRTKLIKSCLKNLIKGHYFTIWGPRQTGKTWLMQQVKAKIERQYQDRKPLILLIDEVDTAPPELLDLLVGRS